MNFFEAMRALESRQPVRLKDQPQITVRVEDIERYIDGKLVKKFLIKFFNSKPNSASLCEPKEFSASFSPDAISAEWELGEPL